MQKYRKKRDRVKESGTAGNSEPKIKVVTVPLKTGQIVGKSIIL